MTLLPPSGQITVTLSTAIRFFLHVNAVDASCRSTAHSFPRSTCHWRSACCSSSMPTCRGEHGCPGTCPFILHTARDWLGAVPKCVPEPIKWSPFSLLACRIPVSSLVDSWPSLLALLKDSIQLGLPSPGQFLILGYVVCCPPPTFCNSPDLCSTTFHDGDRYSSQIKWPLSSCQVCNDRK